LRPILFTLAHQGRTRAGRIYTGVIAYLLCFAALLLFLAHYSLPTVMRGAHSANPEVRLKSQAMAWLLLTVTLVYLLAGLILTFRISRFFFPRPTSPRVRTPHVDIWAEAGKRASAGDKTQDE